MIKSFLIDGVYVPATAISFIRPPNIMKPELITQEWSVHLIGGKILNLIVNKTPYFTKNLKTVTELCDYFGIPKEPYEFG